MKNKIFSILTIFALLGTTLSITAPAYAADATTAAPQNSIFSGFVTFLAQKFGLDENQVKTAATDYKNTVKQKAKDNYETRENNRLDALVKAGKITSDQEAAIKTELATLQSKYNPANFANLTQDQKKQKFTDEKNEIDSWAKSQNIDPKYVMPGFGGFPRAGMKRFDRRGGNFSTPTVTPTPGQ